MKEFEKNFNSEFNYPYVFMNDEPFTSEFKEAVLKLTRAKVEFGLVPKEHWSIPSWIDQQTLNLKFKTILKKMWKGTVISYHHMCRYYSGFFFRHELTMKYEYFWRIEPKVRFPCKITYDPFMFLIKKGKLFGFSISRPELMNTIPTLWSTTRKWLADTYYKDRLAKNNAIGYISSDNGTTLNKEACTFFNNFEIGSFSIFRDRKYLDYFDYLDKSGGFFYERWGDSAITTFYVVMMLNRSQIHFFEDIPYFHPPRYYCPKKLPNNCDKEEIKQCNVITPTSESTERCVNYWYNFK